MTKQDARKVTIIEELMEKRITADQAAKLLELSVRQIKKIKAQALSDGIMSILHKSRGCKPANTLDTATSAAIIQLSKKELREYNFTHTADVLAEERGIFVSVSTVARYLKEQGIRSPKAKRRPKKHRSRDARLHEGAMAQMDASTFDWLGTGSYLHLHGAIDAATGRILALHFEKEETFEGYCELMFQMNHDTHLPREFDTDGRTVFSYDSVKKQKLTIAEELAGKREKQPHFARALQELRILLIIAGSAQAKGAIERLWGTLQDRLPKDMKRNGITSREQANAFLKDYISYYNRKFSVPAAKKEKYYLPKQDPALMQVIFSRQETRKIDTGLSFSYGGKKYRLPRYSDDQRVSPSVHDTIVVACSEQIGIKVLYKGLVITPEVLSAVPNKRRTPQPKMKTSVQNNSASSQIPANSNSPWHIYKPKRSTLTGSRRG